MNCGLCGGMVCGKTIESGKWSVEKLKFTLY